MSMRSAQEKNARKYVVAIMVFIAVVTLCLAVFFASLFANIERVVEHEIWETMISQRDHIDFTFSVRFQHLESAADFLGKQEDVHGETARQYIQSLSEHSSVQHAVIFDADGSAIFESGGVVAATDLAHIRLALQGQRSVSVPAVSSIDGATRFYLSVPIRRGDEVVGALSGSFNTDELGSLLFADGYEGRSVLFIIDGRGQVVYVDAFTVDAGLTVPRDLYGELRGSAVLDGGTAGEIIVSLEARETGMVQYRQEGGGNLFLFYTPIADSGMMLLHAIPRDVAYGEFGFIETSVIIVGVALLACVVALVIFLIASSSNSQRSLVRFAQSDPLTGLANKQYTQEAIDAWLGSETCTGIQALLFIDIDYFKQINDTYGHSVGDDALRFVSGVLRQEFRSSDIIGRIGGDEFVVFMRNVPVRQVVRAHAASLKTRLINAEIPGMEEGLHLSIGIAYAPEHGGCYRELTLCADKALYQTKERGRNGFTEYADGAGEEP